MAQYNAGIMTKEKIICSAKKLFFHNGVESTSLQEVANEAGVKQSLLYYYFKDKDEICSVIHSEFHKNNNRAIVEELERRNIKLSATIERCLAVAAFYKLSLKTPQLTRFFAQISGTDIQLTNEGTRDKYKLLMDEHPGCKLYTNIDYVMLENIALNSVLFKLYYEGKLDYTHEELIRFKLSTIAKSLYILPEDWKDSEREVLRLNDQFNTIINDRFEVSML